MAPHFALNLTAPGELADYWLTAAQQTILRPEAAQLAYLSANGLSLDAINDGGAPEEIYDQGVELWIATTQALFTTLTHWSGGLGTQFQPTGTTWRQRRQSLSLRGKPETALHHDKLWTVTYPTYLDRELLGAVTVYGWDFVFWTALREQGQELVMQRAVRTSDIQQLIQDGSIPWLMTHGYEAWCLILELPGTDVHDAAKIVQEGLPVPVQVVAPGQPARWPRR